MKTSGIYRIDLGNGWFYIGSAQNLERRKRQHRSALDRKDHFNRVMQRCWNKYGIFEFVILQKCATDELVIYEQTHLDKHFDNPRNVTLLQQQVHRWEIFILLKPKQRCRLREKEEDSPPKLEQKYQRS